MVFITVYFCTFVTLQKQRTQFFTEEIFPVEINDIIQIITNNTIMLYCNFKRYHCESFKKFFLYKFKFL